MTDITFKGTALSTLAGVGVTDIIRPTRPPRRRHKVELPGRAGSYDFGNSVAEDYSIQVAIVIQADTAAQLRTRAAALATWADGKGALSFSDAPSTVYQAQVFDEIQMSGPPSARSLRGIITFEVDS